MKQDLNDLMCLDVYLSYENSEDIIKINNTSKVSSKVMPLISWDMYSDQYFKSLNSSRKGMDVKKIKNFAKRHGWKNDIDALFKSLDYSAIILTDSNKKIKWINQGFTTMTGYTKKEALEKKAGFLQGLKTSKKTKAEIEFRLNLNKPFQTKIINYRKNNSEYLCEVHIFPLYNSKKTTTHFIALEKEVLQ